MRQYCESQAVYTVQAIPCELLADFRATCEGVYPTSSYTQANVRERLRNFLRYGFEARWSGRIPAPPKIQAEEPPTLPLSDAEYERLTGALLDRITTTSTSSR